MPHFHVLLFTCEYSQGCKYIQRTAGGAKNHCRRLRLGNGKFSDHIKHCRENLGAGSGVRHQCIRRDIFFDSRYAYDYRYILHTTIRSFPSRYMHNAPRV